MTRGQAAMPEGVVLCPFKGLASFDVEDAEFFFGRERLVAEMVARLVGAPLMGIVGPSGSGKSSALRAGLLPALADGVLPGSERWALALLRPGEHPLRALADAAAAAGPVERLVVAVDQFEEVFTACRDEAERDGVRGRAGRLRARPAAPRASCWSPSAPTSTGAARATPSCGGCWAPTRSRSGRCGATSCAARSSCPRARAGLQVEPELTDALIADVEGEPGALPLMSTSLLELWQQRDGRRLRMSRLRAGRRRATARSRAWRSAPTSGWILAQRDIARRILLRSAARARATRSCAGACRSTSCRARVSPRSSTCSPTTGW